MEVEVVLRQVREDERAEADAVEPAERRAVRGRLDGRAAVAGVEHLAELALQVDRLGRRADGRPALAADAALDRPEQPGPPAGRGEDRVEQERGRRLAVRAGHAGDLELLRRPAEELVGGDGHRCARARDDELRHVELERPLDDQRHRAVRDRVGGELVPVRARPGNAEEEAPRPGGAGVVGEVGDLDGSPPEHVRRRERRDQLVDLHRGASLPPGPAEAARPRAPRTASLQHFCDTSDTDTCARRSIRSPWGGGRANRTTGP